MLSPSDIRSAVREVLLSTENSLASYQILERLPTGLRDQIIAERGLPGAGSGNSYSAASLVTDAVEGLLPSLDPPYRVYMDVSDVTFSVAGNNIHAGNAMIAFYRLPSPALAPAIAPSMPATLGSIPPPAPKVQTMKEGRKTPWYDSKGWLFFWLVFFWPAFLYGLWRTKSVSNPVKLAIVLVGLAFFVPIAIITETANPSNTANEAVISEDSAAPKPPVESKKAHPASSVQVRQITKSTSATRQNNREQEQAKAERKKQAVKERIARYSREILPHVDSITQGIGQLTEASSEAGNNPYLILNDDWRIKAALACTLMRTGSEGIRSIDTVPDEAKSAHRLLTRLANESYRCTENFTRGIDNKDARELQSAARRMMNITSLSNEVRDELNRMIERYDLLQE